jgi:hypothetical protein
MPNPLVWAFRVCMIVADGGWTAADGGWEGLLQQQQPRPWLCCVGIAYVVLRMCSITPCPHAACVLTVLLPVCVHGVCAGQPLT